MTPKISVIIPCYNAQSTIKTCLEAIFNANYPKDSLEVLVVDNNSKDDSLLIAENFPVKIIKESTQGRSYARNTGAKEASGEFYAFLDADTHIDPDWFNGMLESFRDPLVGGSQGQIIPSFVDGRQGLNQFRYQAVFRSTFGTFNLLEIKVREAPMINSAACMYRSQAFHGVGGFDPFLERHEDIDLSRRVCLSGFDLSTSPMAKCHVIFHGGGWLNYFWRSFWDGYYKNDYLKKWSRPIQFNYPEISEEPVQKEEAAIKIPHKVPKKKRFKNIYVLYPLFQFYVLFKKWILERERFWILSFISEWFKLWGRVWGLSRQYAGSPVAIQLSEDLMGKRVFKVGDKASYQVSDNLRFIRTNNGVYGFNIDTNEHFELGTESGVILVFLKAAIMGSGIEEYFSSHEFHNLLQEKGIIK